jgi:hypothetical protein
MSCLQVLQEGVAVFAVDVDSNRFDTFNYWTQCPDAPPPPQPRIVTTPLHSVEARNGGVYLQLFICLVAQSRYSFTFKGSI